MVRLTRSKPRRSAREVALDCLSRRALTHYELETRLKEKGYESSEINAVLERFLEWGYLNDQEIALTYSESRLKRYSRRRVQQDMQNRGLVPQLIEQALGATYSSDDEFQQCLVFAKRWWLQECMRLEHKSELVQLKLNIESLVGDSTPNEAEYEDPLLLEEVGVLRLDKADSIKRAVPRELWIRQKVARKLVQRGYSSDMVRNALSHIQNNEGENIGENKEI